MARSREASTPAPHKPRVPKAKWTPETEDLLAEWANRAAAARCAHYELVDLYRRRYNWLGVPVVLLSSIVGTSLFATLSEESVSRPLRLAAGLVSVGAAALAAVQTFLRYGERAERHMVAADWYAGLHRKAKQVLTLPRENRPDMVKCLDEMRREMARVGQQSPEIGEKRWHRNAAAFGIHDGTLRPMPAASAVEAGTESVFDRRD